MTRRVSSVWIFKKRKRGLCTVECYATTESLCTVYLLDDNFHLSCACVSLKNWYLGFEFGPTTFGPEQFKIWYLVRHKFGIWSFGNAPFKFFIIQ